MMNHSVVSFLGRPQLISSFPWSASASRSQNILPSSLGGGKILVPTTLLTPQYKNKLDGFTSIRATAVIKLQINAQPFQAGRLIVGAVPMPSMLGNRKEFVFKHISSVQCVNHVQMDISKQTEVELRIPFISPYNSFDLIDGKFDWAEVRVLVYSKLNSTDAAPLQCVMWAHFEDIELGAPTSGMVKQQSGQLNSSLIHRAREEESKGERVGTLANLGQKIGSGLDMISSAFGWSKPILSKPSCPVLLRPTEGFQNVDGIDHSNVLALSAGNAVEYYPSLAGTRLDEMSFDFLKKIPQNIATFQFGKDTKYNDRLWDCAVSPSTNIPACYYINPEASEASNVYTPYKMSWKQPTTLNYITSPFLYWTGSLVYTFRFVKTDYHSGRVEISFHPFVSSVDQSRMDYVYKAIVDLRENSEVSVTVPYISPQPWKRISTYLDPVNPNPPSPGRTTDVITGILYVRALTPLICANSIIGSTIEVLVEMRAGDDFQVQAPLTSKFLPFTIGNPTIGIPKQQSGNLRKSQRGVDIRAGNIMSSNVYTLDLNDSVSEVKADIVGFYDKYMEFDGYVRIFFSKNQPDDTRSRINLTLTRQETDGTTQPPLVMPLQIIKNYYGVSTDIVLPLKFYYRGALRITLTKSTNQFANAFLFGTATWFNTDVTIAARQLPLPCALEGGGTIPTVLKIDTSDKPLWVSETNASQLAREQAGVFKKLLGTAGTSETRTTAIEGWTPPSITGNESDIHRPNTVQYCAGEVFESYRQLTRRFTYMLANGITRGKNLTITPAELIKPGALHLRTINAPDQSTQFALYAPYSDSEISSCPLNFVAGMYAFYRGGLRFKVWIDNIQNPVELISMNLEYARDIIDANVTVDKIENFLTPIAYELPRQKQFGEFQIPYYSPTITSAMWSHPTDNQFDTPLLNAVIGVPSNVQAIGVQNSVKVAIAGADDFDCQVFIGPPPAFPIQSLTDGETGMRIFHYPKSGFTPTQNVLVQQVEDLDNPSFLMLEMKYLSVVSNDLGNSCQQTVRAELEDLALREKLSYKASRDKNFVPPATKPFTPILDLLNNHSRYKREDSSIPMEIDTEDGQDTVDSN